MDVNESKVEVIGDSGQDLSNCLNFIPIKKSGCPVEKPGRMCWEDPREDGE